MWTPSLADRVGDPSRAHGRGISVAAAFWKCKLLQSPNQALGYGVGCKPRDSGNSGVLVGLLPSLVTGSSEPKWDHRLWLLPVFLGGVAVFGVWVSQLCVLSPETVTWMKEMSNSSQYSLTFWGLLGDRPAPNIFLRASLYIFLCLLKKLSVFSLWIIQTSMQNTQSKMLFPSSAFHPSLPEVTQI